jgi:acetyl esterase/lipase
VLLSLVLGLRKIEVLSESDVNLEHISVVGHSAGGHLAAMLAVQLQDVLLTSVKTADVIVPEAQAHHHNAKTIKLDGVGHFDWIHRWQRCV